MKERKELVSKDIQILEKTDEELLEEFDKLVVDDPDSPYLVSRRTSLAFRIKQFISFDGHFSSGVAYYAIAIIGSVFILCGSYTEDSSHKFVWAFIGSSLVAQVIDSFSKKLR